MQTLLLRSDCAEGTVDSGLGIPDCIRSHPNEAFQHNDLVKRLSPNIITFSGIGGSDSDIGIWGEGGTQLSPSQPVRVQMRTNKPEIYPGASARRKEDAERDGEMPARVAINKVDDVECSLCGICCLGQTWLLDGASKWGPTAGTLASPGSLLETRHLQPPETH